MAVGQWQRWRWAGLCVLNWAVSAAAARAAVWLQRLSGYSGCPNRRCCSACSAARAAACWRRPRRDEESPPRRLFSAESEPLDRQDHVRWVEGTPLGPTRRTARRQGGAGRGDSGGDGELGGRRARMDAELSGWWAADWCRQHSWWACCAAGLLRQPWPAPLPAPPSALSLAPTQPCNSQTPQSYSTHQC